MSDTNFEQGQLFPLEPFPVDPRAVVLDRLSEVGVEGFNGGGKYARVRIKPGSELLIPGDDYISQWNDRYADEDLCVIGWTHAPDHIEDFHEGFIEAVSFLRETNEPIIHFLAYVTDVYANSFAVRAADVSELSIYNENAASVMAMYQNALDDGDSIGYSRMKGYSLGFRIEELKPYISDHWPEPELIFKSSV